MTEWVIKKTVNIAVQLDWKMPCTKSSSQKADGEVYVIIRFKIDVAEVVRTACFKEKKVIENYNGRVLGIANGVTIYEGSCWPSDQGMLIIEFKNKQCAQLWLDSDRKFRNKEWPSASSSLEIIMVPLLYKPPKTALTFQLIELADFMDACFQERYVLKVPPIMDKFLIRHGVVATDTVEGVRNGWIGNKSYFILNACEKPVELDAFYYSDDYGPYKEYRQSACRTENIVFTLDPNLSPPCSK